MQKVKKTVWQQTKISVKKISSFLDKIDCMKSRSILWYLVFVGFSVNYMIRININIAIVDMIDTNFKKSTNNTVITSECLTVQNYTYPVNVTNNVWKHDEKQNKSATEKKEYISLEKRFLNAFKVIIFNQKSARH